MTAGKFQSFFGEDFEDTIESLKSAPGAFGNILIAALRQVRPIDLACLCLMAAGWTWLAADIFFLEGRGAGLTVLALLPTAIWILAGLTGATLFVTGGIGPRALHYWESYVLILLFSGFGIVSLRLALNPRDYRVYRSGTPNF